ncbi:DegT/DnrJ/EryC1/StrS aminotransferase family protein [Yimella sp. cx-573]|nr:DegT/DnrJ/EryC1/StrS aminotransferase family protein [Yimella sp. cx-573]
MSSDPADTVRRLLAERTGTEPGDWYPVFKARYGMEVVFRAIGQTHGTGEVLTQIFTCSTAVTPILAAGMRAAYGDVSAASIALDPTGVPLTDATKAVVLQHTFGIVDHARARALRAVADTAGAVLVEDSAHCVGRLALAEDGSPLADISVHSFGAEKMLPTRFGGAIWINPERCDEHLRRRLAQELGTLRTVTPRIDRTARLYKNQVRVLNRLPGGVATKARSTLARAGLFEPLISTEETTGSLPYAAMAPSPWMLQQIAETLPRLATIEQTRSAAVAVYLETLRDVVQIPESITPDSALVRFPFFVASSELAERLVTKVTEAGFYAGRWYRPALFPGVADPAEYGYRVGDPALATSEDLIARVVNLPTNISTDEARRAAAVVREVLGAG